MRPRVRTPRSGSPARRSAAGKVPLRLGACLHPGERAFERIRTGRPGQRGVGFDSRGFPGGKGQGGRADPVRRRQAADRSAPRGGGRGEDPDRRQRRVDRIRGGHRPARTLPAQARALRTTGPRRESRRAAAIALAGPVSDCCRRVRVFPRGERSPPRWRRWTGGRRGGAQADGTRRAAPVFATGAASGCARRRVLRHQLFGRRRRPAWSGAPRGCGSQGRLGLGARGRSAVRERYGAGPLPSASGGNPAARSARPGSSQSDDGPTGSSIERSVGGPRSSIQEGSAMDRASFCSAATDRSSSSWCIPWLASGLR